MRGARTILRVTLSRKTLDKLQGLWFANNVDDIAEFPFVADLPKREKTKLASLWDNFQEIKTVTEAHGMLVPVSLAAELLGISRQRIHELMEAGRLQRVEFRGRAYMTEDQLHEYARAERKAGRPPKVRTLFQVAKLAATPSKILK